MRRLLVSTLVLLVSLTATAADRWPFSVSGSGGGGGASSVLSGGGDIVFMDGSHSAWGATANCLQAIPATITGSAACTNEVTRWRNSSINAIRLTYWSVAQVAISTNTNDGCTYTLMTGAGVAAGTDVATLTKPYSGDTALGAGFTQLNTAGAVYAESLTPLVVTVPAGGYIQIRGDDQVGACTVPACTCTNNTNNMLFIVRGIFQ